MGVSADWDLSPADWAVLGAVGDGPTHGFAVARLLAPDGALGQVWSMPRAGVYQVLTKLLRLGLIAERSTERGNRGPVRTIVGITPAGRRALKTWLREPVDHVRDVRSLLLLKLAFLDRRHEDAGPLLDAQRLRVMTQMLGLEQGRTNAVGFDRVLTEWRLTSSKATIEFLDSIRALVADS